jgi:hypothetical protein
MVDDDAGDAVEFCDIDYDIGEVGILSAFPRIAPVADTPSAYNMVVAKDESFQQTIASAVEEQAATPDEDRPQHRDRRAGHR